MDHVTETETTFKLEIQDFKEMPIKTEVMSSSFIESQAPAEEHESLLPKPTDNNSAIRVATWINDLQESAGTSNNSENLQSELHSDFSEDVNTDSETNLCKYSATIERHSRKRKCLSEMLSAEDCLLIAAMQCLIRGSEEEEEEDKHDLFGKLIAHKMRALSIRDSDEAEVRIMQLLAEYVKKPIRK